MELSKTSRNIPVSDQRTEKDVEHSISINESYQTNRFSSVERRSIDGGRGKPPPRNRKKVLLKNGVISEGSIFSNKFSKKI